jgi:sigma-B regulation protein RsbU (phosphoserine phosphatase)
MMIENHSQDITKGDILIVDDTPANLRLLAKMLSDRGYHVRPVTDGQLALSAVKAQPPDLILLDIRMPGMNGFQFCEILKADQATHDIPVIFISAMDALEDKIKAFTAGGVDYVTKPFQIEEVLARVETHLTLSHLREQLQSANQKMSQELNLAGEVQRSFLQFEQPILDGWDIAIRLKPAKETSGDFLDFNLRSDKQVDILVADVVDKGVSAALFMALSWIIFHTYAEQYPGRPELVLEAVNRQILKYTQSRQFITVFFSVLNPADGKMVYSNGGHPPPILFRGDTYEFVEVPKVRNIPLGLIEDYVWERGTLELNHGDVLVLYTDGIIEAQNPEGVFYSNPGLIQSIRKNLGKPADQMADSILEELQIYLGEKPVADDIALMVVVRE